MGTIFSDNSCHSYTLSAIGRPFLLYLLHLEVKANFIFSGDLVRAVRRLLEWICTPRAAGARGDPRILLLHHDDETILYNQQHLAQALRHHSEPIRAFDIHLIFN